MPSEVSIIEDLAIALTQGFGPEFTVLPAKTYVAIMHPELGLATVSPTDQEAVAQNAANDFTTKAALAGVAWPAVYFGLSSTKVSPPWLIRTGPKSVVDIISTMKLSAAVRTPLGADKIKDIVLQFSNNTSKPSVLNNQKKIVPAAEVSIEMIRMIKACSAKVLAGRQAFLAEVEIDVDDFAAPNFLLPALLVAAAQKWTMPVVAKKGEGGFLVRMEKDEKAVLGYKVNSIHFSSPLLLFLPTVQVIKASKQKDKFIMDDIVQEFSDYLERNGLDNSDLIDTDMSA